MPRVLVITALQEELDAVLRLKPGGYKDWFQRKTENGYLFYEAEFQDNMGNPFEMIASVQPAKGIIASAIHTTRMLTTRMLRFSPDLVFMTGVCAGRRKKGIELGDIVVGDMAFHYEVGKRDEGVFKPEMSSSKAHPQVIQWLNDFESKKIPLVQIIQTPRPTSLRFQKEWILFKLWEKELESIEWPVAENDFVESRNACPNWEQAISSLLSERLIEQTPYLKLTAAGRNAIGKMKTEGLTMQPRPDRSDPKVWIGAFATGSSVIAETDFFDKLERRERTVLALDMEASAFLEAVYGSRTNLFCVVIKGVCDFADNEKDDAFHEYAAEAAARWMLAFAQYTMPLINVSKADGRGKVIYPISLPRPALTYQDRVRWQTALQWPSDNEEFFAERYKEEGYSGLEFYTLGRDQFLLEVSLGFGCYQGSYLYIYLDEREETPKWDLIKFRKIYILSSKTDGLRETIEEEIVGLQYFNEEDRTLTVFTKARGLGDCGALATYKIDNGSATLTQLRAKDCGDFSRFSFDESTDTDNGLDERNTEEKEINPDEWPLIDITKKYPLLDLSEE